MVRLTRPLFFVFRLSISLCVTAATMLQRWWATTSRRLHFRRAMTFHRNEKRAATVIQANYRGHLYRRRRGEAKARAVANWGFFYCFVYHFQHKSMLVTRVQRFVRKTAFRVYSLEILFFFPSRHSPERNRTAPPSRAECFASTFERG